MLSCCWVGIGVCAGSLSLAGGLVEELLDCQWYVNTDCLSEDATAGVGGKEGIAIWYTKHCAFEEFVELITNSYFDTSWEERVVGGLDFLEFVEVSGDPVGQAWAILCWRTMMGQNKRL